MYNLLAEQSLKYSSKVLSLLDKADYSSTYGCFDRNYWHYKTVIDYPSATYQQAVLYLANLYSYNLPGNTFYKQDDILKLCVAGIDFWVKIQNPDGTFNEWYPNEHSHVATAFTLYAITESLLLLKDVIDEKKLKSYFPAILKSTEWLAKNPDKQVLNHTAGALMSIYNTYLLTKKEELVNYTDNNLNVLIENQSPEGWFNEYYGADIGYTSVSIDYLAKYYSKTGDERVYNILDKAVSFLTYFVHPDGSSGGEYCIRNTKYIMPAGLHILAKYFEDARYLLDKFYYGLKNQTQVGLDIVDDRYFVFFFIPNYIEAAVIYNNLKYDDFKYNKSKYDSYSHIFTQAGLIVKKTPDYYFVCNYKKGGTLKLYKSDGGLVYSDSSYYIKFENNKIASSQYLSDIKDYYIDNSQDNSIEIKLESPFMWVNTSLPLTKILIPFRIFNYTLGRFGYIMNYFNKHLKKFMISKPKQAPLKVKRHISIIKNVLTINDIITKYTDLKVKLVELPCAKSNLHVPSSRYNLTYDIKEFTEINPDCVMEINTVNTANVKTQVEIK